MKELAARVLVGIQLEFVPLIGSATIRSPLVLTLPAVRVTLSIRGLVRRAGLKLGLVQFCSRTLVQPEVGHARRLVETLRE